MTSDLASPGAGHGDKQQRLLELLRSAIDDGTWVKLTLSAPLEREADLRQLLLRPVELRGEAMVSCVWRHKARDVTKNMTATAACELVARALASEFTAAHLFTTKLSAQYEARDGKPARLRQGLSRHDVAPKLTHDRQKQRAFALGDAPWLVALDVITAAGHVKHGMQGKLRQIEKFIELVAQRVPAEWLVPREQALRIVDMGAGKGYLTFALAAWLQGQGVHADILGVEARADLVASGNALARAQGFLGVRFVVGTIANTQLAGVDLLLALHACDTATDDALAKGIAAGAQVILASPCCHKELRPQMAPPPALRPALRHGILCERQAELVTDALRAALLTARGYDAEVFEFIATEHSAKNLLLAASKRRASTDPAPALAAVRDLAGHFGIRRQRLAEHLGVSLVAEA